MAAASPMQGMQEETTCPICLEYYKDPVITKCGHNFCWACITGCSEGGGTALPCPQCREICSQGDLRPNRQLQSIVEFVKQLSVQQKRPQEDEGLCEEHEERLKLFCEEDEKLICLICRESRDHKKHTVHPIKEAAQEYRFVKQLSVQRERPPGEGGLCEEHEERLKLYCEEDEKLICVICRESRDHKKHTVYPIKEAAQEYTSKLRDWLPALRAEMSNALQTRLKEEQDCVALRNKLAAERKKITTEFKKLQQLLKEQEETLLERLEEMDKKITTFENAKMAELSAELSSLEGLITEIEQKCEQPAGELLKDVSSTLSRCERVPVQTPEGIRKKYKEPVTLDADTAHGRLALSEAGRRVAHTCPEQTPPDHPKRFTGWRSVLGTEGFTSGKHYWELEMLRNKGWRLGVAQETVSRKERFTHCPEEGVWAVMWDKKECKALTSPPSPLSPPLPLRKLGVYLDYEGGRLSVYNASTMEVVYTFTGATFTGQVCPYFYPWDGTDLRLV